mmetsp:Transcript_3600/g.3557  ORF Transcript_3600/g.3557 Transcript_3600/m.3557 type:complete len:94 (+) Transcript_3600:20-301(+)
MRSFLSPENAGKESDPSTWENPNFQKLMAKGRRTKELRQNSNINDPFTQDAHLNMITKDMDSVRNVISFSKLDKPLFQNQAWNSGLKMLYKEN